MATYYGDFDLLKKKKAGVVLSSKSHFFYGYIIVAVCFLMLMGIMGLVTSFGLFFEPLSTDLGWTRTATSAAFSLNVMIGGIFGIIGGMLNDKFGPRVVLPLFGILSAAGYFLVSHMNTVWQFYLYFGLIVGMGSNVFVPALSTVARWFVRRRSMMSGIAFSGAGFGLVILPPVINWIIRQYDWRLSLVIMSIMILIITVLGIILLRNDPGKMGLLPYGAETKANENTKSESGSFSFSDAIRRREFWLLAFTLFCYGFCFMAFQVHVAVYSNDVGISSTGAAMILTMLGIATIAGQIGLGGVGDKAGYKRTFVLGLFCIVLAVITILFARQLWSFFIFAVLLGLAFGNCSTQESPLIAWLFGLGSHGTLLGVFAFSWTCGAAAGPLVFGSIYDSRGSYQYAFWIAGVLAVTAVISALFIKRPAPGYVDIKIGSTSGS